MPKEKENLMGKVKVSSKEIEMEKETEMVNLKETGRKMDLPRQMVRVMASLKETVMTRDSRKKMVMGFENATGLEKQRVRVRETPKMKDLGMVRQS